VLLLPKKCNKWKNPYLVARVRFGFCASVGSVRFGFLLSKISVFWFGSVLTLFRVLVRVVRDSSGSFHISTFMMYTPPSV
jgi:hypothetical protein